MVAALPNRLADFDKVIAIKLMTTLDEAVTYQLCDCNYPPPALSYPAETAPRMVLNGLASVSRAVSTVVRMSASASAAHLAR